MNKKTLNFLVEYGLHDSVLRKCTIDYKEKKISFDILANENKIYLELSKIRSLSIEKNDDFKNKEIILDFSITKMNEMKIFTTSNTCYRISFEESSVLTDF